MVMWAMSAGIIILGGCIFLLTVLIACGYKEASRRDGGNEMVSKADMMMARDKVAQAWSMVQAADAAWDAEASEEANARQASAVRNWKKAVMAREAMERRMWTEQDAD